MHIPDIVKAVGCLTQLSDLRLLHLFRHDLTTTDCLEIIRCAPKLKYIELDSTNCTIDVDSYLKILDVVAKRDERRCLELHLLRSGCVNVSNVLLRANQDLLKIFAKFFKRSVIQKANQYSFA